MREIKFRGQRVDNGKWVYGYYYVQKFMTNARSDQHRISDGLHDSDQVIPETVGQYLRKDKNGIDIYSNMPIRYCDKDYPKGFVWDESGIRWTLNDGYYHTHYGRTGTGTEDDYLDLEVIHEDPELMEK